MFDTRLKLMNKGFSVLHTVASLDKQAGGPTQTVTAVCRELGRFGIQVELLSQDTMRSTDDKNLLPPVEFVTTSLASVHRLPYVSITWSPQFRTMLRKRCEHGQAMLIHDHGIWLPTNHSAAVVANQFEIPRIVSPRGMLEPWALNYRAWKKRLAWRLYQHHDLQTAWVLHATADQEAENLRRLGLCQPIAVIPNGVNLPAFLERQPLSKLRTALFVGRIHPVKGLLNLVEAWRIAQPIGWKFIIAGPDEGGHRQTVLEAIHHAGLENNFELVGAVDSEDKIALYQQADLFVLPSFTENFGVVVAEALACGVPVITTRGTPWEGLLIHRCGWWIDLGVEPLVAAIREATTLSGEQRRDMGRRGRHYVEREFGWPDIAQQMLSVYRWVLGQGNKPDCVMSD